LADSVYASDRAEKAQKNEQEAPYPAKAVLGSPADQEAGPKQARSPWDAGHRAQELPGRSTTAAPGGSRRHSIGDHHTRAPSRLPAGWVEKVGQRGRPV